MECFKSANEDQSNQHLNARQLFAKLRGPFGCHGLQTPDAVEGTQVNHRPTFTDGSLTHPQTPEWSLAGVGVVHIGRDTAESPLHHTEQHCALHDTTGVNTKLWAPLPGQFCSSTRAEIAAGLLDIASPGPVAIRTDSKVFLDGLSKMLDDPLFTPRRPWGLTANGDLWQLVEHHLQTKGIHSVIAKWIKAHTGDKEVAEGLLTAAEQFGNAEADELARLGGNSFAKDLHKLSGLYAFKHRLYKLILAQIHAHILRVLEFEQELRDMQKRRRWLTENGTPAVGIKPTMPAHTAGNARYLDVRPVRAEMLQQCNVSMLTRCWAFLSLF